MRPYLTPDPLNPGKLSIQQFMPPILRSVPVSVWRSEDFDCETVFNEIFKSGTIDGN